MNNELEKTLIEQEIDIAEFILQELMGKNERGESKSAITVDFLLYDEIKDQTKEISNVSIHEPTLRIERRGELVQLDICFNSAMNNNLRILWSIFESYGKELDKYDEIVSDEVPIFNIVAVPVSLADKYCVSLVNPIFWVLQPDTPGGQCNMIRILLYEDNVDFLEVDGIDVNEIENEVKVEEAQEEARMIKQINKELDEEEYEAERERRLEEIKKNPNKYQ